MRKITVIACMFCCFIFPYSVRAASLNVDAEQKGQAMSGTLYGLFFEDINHAADGGLYAELLQNRSFEYRSLPEVKEFDAFTGWLFNYGMSAVGKATRMTEHPLNEKNPVYMRVNVISGDYRVINSGYSVSQGKAGIPINAEAEYRLAVYFRADGFEGTVRVELTDLLGKPLSNTTVLSIGDEWEKFSYILKASETADAVLMITLSGSGQVDMDMASLLPANAYGAGWQNGGLRADLVKVMEDLHPRFIRFPGGCVAEGSYHVSNFYNWKDTIGPVEERRENENTWGYMQSYGIGFHEYFQLCEDLGAEPLPVVNAAMLCQVRENFDLPVTGEELDNYIQDVLDLIEYANGDIATEWGSKRAANGHLKTFGLKHIAIGNENWGSEYFYRYGRISEAVKEKYPDVTCIVAAGPVAEGGLFDSSWVAIRNRFPDDLVDEHYYMSCDWFLDNVLRYDDYSRKANGVFLGEYAAHEAVIGNRRPNTVYSALSEAAYLTGIERNSDLVEMSCYAPLLARDGFQQWTPNLVWFNARSVLLTPNYYVQQMFSETLGEFLLTSLLDAPDKVYQVSSLGNDKVYIKIVNVSGSDLPLELHVNGVSDGVFMIKSLSHTNPKATNSFLLPDNIVPVSYDAELVNGKAGIILPSYSLTICEIDRK